LSNIFLENDFAPIQGKRHGLLSRPSRSVGTLKGQCGTHRANWQASSPPAVRCRRSKISAGKNWFVLSVGWQNPLMSAMPFAGNKTNQE
jgi:hypothetical protein